MSKLRHAIRDHLGPVLAGTAACVVLVGGILLLTVVGSGGTSSGAGSSAPPGTTTTTQPPSNKGKASGRAVRGSVVAIAGDTWTVTVRGATVTVNLTPKTRFGTKAAPLAQTDFPVGTQVVILGARSGTTITATRVAPATPPVP